MREVREFVRAFVQQMAREQAVELGKIANNQFKSGKDAKHIAGKIYGLRRAGDIAEQMSRQMQDAEDGGDLPTMGG